MPRAREVRAGEVSGEIAAAETWEDRVARREARMVARNRYMIGLGEKCWLMEEFIVSLKGFDVAGTDREL